MGRIFFDFSTMVRWTGRPTGIPRTIDCLARSFRKVFPDTIFVSIDEGAQEFFEWDWEKRRATEAVSFQKGDRLFSCGANWAFACYNQVILRLKAVGVEFYPLFYDLIPTLFPHFYEQAEGYGNYMGNWTAETLALATQSFSISEATRTDIYRWTGRSPEEAPIHVIRLGDELHSVLRGQASASEFLKWGRFVLSVGTLELRKNHVVLLNAFRLLHEAGVSDLPKLVLVGRPGWLNNSLEFQVAHDPALKGRVFILPDASDDDLDWLYRHCEYSAFPSLYEGWGLPIAESLRRGKQCIASNSSSMREVAPDLVRFAHPLKTDEWATNIRELNDHPERLQRENERVRLEYRGSTWDDCALSILNRIQEG